MMPNHMKSLKNILRYYKEGKRLINNSYYRECFELGSKLLNDKDHLEATKKSMFEENNGPGRTKVINYLLSLFDRDTKYLEIGVRNPNDNFNHIRSAIKYSVDPGFEYIENPVDFKMTSDLFFENLNKNKILSNEIKFDLIFIDGLHLAEQVNQDISNSIDFISEDGFIVLHDCNPPTEWHARENYHYIMSPAKNFWNGTTWKAFVKWRSNSLINSCCVDTDWGVGVFSKVQPIGKCIEEKNPFYEFNLFDSNRIEYLNLISFEELKRLLSK
jgi:hypothetical protein